MAAVRVAWAMVGIVRVAMAAMDDGGGGGEGGGSASNRLQKSIVTNPANDSLLINQLLIKVANEHRRETGDVRDGLGVREGQEHRRQSERNAGDRHGLREDEEAYTTFQGNVSADEPAAG